MTWKEDLVKKIYALKPEDFVDGKATIYVSARAEALIAFWNAFGGISFRHLAAVAPSFLRLVEFGTVQRFGEDFTEIYLVFEMLDREGNPSALSPDSRTWIKIPISESVDFMSL